MDARPQSAPEGPLIDIGRTWSIMRERWLGAVLVALLSCGLVGWLLLREKPEYSATAMLLLERSTDRVVDIKQVVDNSVDSSLTDALLLTHIQQIQSHAFLSRVVKALKPEEREELMSLYPLGGPEVSAAARRGPEEEANRIEEFIAKRMKVDRANRTLLITITVRHRSPLECKLLANRVAQEYIDYLIDRSSDSNDSALSFLSKQAEQLRQTVQASEQKVQAYREANNLFFLEQNQNIVTEKLRSLSSSVTQARVARLAMEARVSQAESAAHDTDMRQLSSVPEFASFANVQRQLDDLRSKREVMSARYGKRHPLMLDNANATKALEKLREAQIAAALADLRNQRDKFATDEKQLALELSAAEKESLRLDQLAVEYNFLRREVETTRQTYAQILARLNETTISSRLQNTNIKLADPASTPLYPISPNRTKIAAILLALGLVMLVGYPLLTDSLDKRIRSWTDVERGLSVSLLGEISSARKIPAEDRALILSRHGDSHVAEEFRGLYNQIWLAAKREHTTTFLVTSTIPSEGKSFVAANLAGACAAHGHRTLLVDADFRRPSLHRLLNLPNDHGFLRWAATKERRLTEIETNPELGLKDVAPNLWLLRSGGESRKLSELIESGGLPELLRALSKDFDLVIIDSPPAGVFPDADALCAISDELLYVCKFEGAHRHHAAQTLERFRRRGVKIIGAVLNGMSGRRAMGYYTSRWSQGGKYYESYHTSRG